MEDLEYQCMLQRAVNLLRHGADAVLEDLEAQGGGVPGLNYMTGGYRGDPEYVWDSWAGFQWVGFLSGRLWLLHLLTGEQRYADAALGFCRRVGPVLARNAAVFSAAGTDIYYGLCLGYQVTGREELREWALAGARNLEALFDRRAGAFLQIATADRVVVDTGLNLPPFLWAARWEPARADLAVRHLETVLRIGLLREDGSSFHAAALDPETRRVTHRFTLQGWRDESTWARGQSWAIHGFAHGFEATAQEHYLAAARRAADWYLDHAPADWVPHYDFDDPERHTLPRDACAASIATANLLRLARWLPERANRYRAVARATLAELVRNYLGPGGVVLHSSWGRMRHREEGKPGLGRFPQEDVMPYANYWIAECLFRELRDDWSPLALDPQPAPAGAERTGHR